MTKNMDYHSVFRKKVIDYLRKSRKQITTPFRYRHKSFIHLSRFDYETLIYDFNSDDHILTPDSISILFDYFVSVTPYSNSFNFNCIGKDNMFCINVRGDSNVNCMNCDNVNYSVNCKNCVNCNCCVDCTNCMNCNDMISVKVN